MATTLDALLNGAFAEHVRREEVVRAQDDSELVVLKLGEGIAGTIVQHKLCSASKEHPDWTPSYLVKLDTVNGRKHVFGKTNMAKQMKDANVGQMVAIVYEGIREASNGNSFHSWVIKLGN